MNYLTVKGKANRNLNIWNDVDNFFDSFFSSPWDVPAVRTPVAEVRETEQGLHMSLELPGFSKEDLEVRVEENLLTIKAAHREEKKEKKKKDLIRHERRDIRFERSFVLPQDVDHSKIDADLKNGLLTLNLPRYEKAAPLNIKVNG